MTKQKAQQLISELIQTAMQHVVNGEPEMAMVVFDEWAYEYPEAASVVDREAFETAIMNG